MLFKSDKCDRAILSIPQQKDDSAWKVHGVYLQSLKILCGLKVQNIVLVLYAFLNFTLKLNKVQCLFCVLRHKRIIQTRDISNTDHAVICVLIFLATLRLCGSINM